MQLHVYDLEAMISLLTTYGVDKIYMHPFPHDEFQSVALYGQKTKGTVES